jgi:CheY-like chemotaxis protein
LTLFGGDSDDLRPAYSTPGGGHLTTTLLAVDDSKTMRKVLEITFAGEDYRVVQAESSDDALSKLRSDHPAVAVVDAKLGQDSGYDLCQRIKSAAPGTRVLILSSKHQPYDRGRGSSVGADDFIDKPFDTQQLIDKIAALARKAAETGPVAAQGAPAASATPYRSLPQDVAAQPPAAAVRPRASTLTYGAPQPSPPQPAPAPAVRPAPPAVAPIAPTPLTGVQLPREAPTPAAAPRAAVPVATPATLVTGNGQFKERLGDLGLSKEQIEGVLALSRQVIEQVVWEVVPQLAETMIQEEIRRLTSE